LWIRRGIRDLDGHVMRRDDTETVRTVIALSVEGRKGRSSRIPIRRDMKTAAGVCANDVDDRG